MSSLGDASVYGVVGVVEILHIRSCLHRFYGRVSSYRYGKNVQTQRSYRLYTLLCGNLVSFVFAYSSLSFFYRKLSKLPCLRLWLFGFCLRSLWSSEGARFGLFNLRWISGCTVGTGYEMSCLYLM